MSLSYSQKTALDKAFPRTANEDAVLIVPSNLAQYQPFHEHIMKLRNTFRTMCVRRFKVNPTTDAKLLHMIGVTMIPALIIGRKTKIQGIQSILEWGLDECEDEQPQYTGPKAPESSQADRLFGGSDDMNADFEARKSRGTGQSAEPATDMPPKIDLDSIVYTNEIAANMYTKYVPKHDIRS